MDLALRSATDLSRMMRRGDVTATEVLDAHLARHERFNGAVNAVVVTQIEAARARARAADAALERGELWGPLHGVPMTIKEAFDWEGTPSTWGVPARKDDFAERNAVAVQRLLDAGAVVYGKTNVPFMLGDWQSFNEIYGTTNNPWDLSRVPGGSSGGAAAALATGMAALELGSDIGSSIRNPAHYCGVFGHKPTFGVVPMGGHAHPGQVGVTDIDVAGPLARSADDLDLALRVLAGPDVPDAAAWRLELPEAPQMSLRDFKVGVMLQSPCVAQDDELTAQLERTVDELARLGVTVVDGARPEMDLQRAHEVYLLLLRAATGVRVTDEQYEVHLEGARAATQRDTGYRGYVDRGVTLTFRDWWALHEERERMRLAWAAYFEEYDLMLCPTAASAAFHHLQEGERPDRTFVINGRDERYVDQLFWAGWSGAAYLPGTVAPAGLTRSGLPCGLQIVAPHLHDRRGIRFAQLMEREIGGFVPPPGYE